MVDQIEFQVSKTLDYVKDGKDQTKKALEFQSKSRRVSIQIYMIHKNFFIYILSNCMTYDFHNCILFFILEKNYNNSDFIIVIGWSHYLSCSDIR
jgi:hypothetical protein